MVKTLAHHAIKDIFVKEIMICVASYFVDSCKRGKYVFCVAPFFVKSCKESDV